VGADGGAGNWTRVLFVLRVSAGVGFFLTFSRFVWLQPAVQVFPLLLMVESVMHWWIFP
jgi:hypothetical protein